MSSSANCRRRLRSLRQEMAAAGLDWMLFTHLPNIYYLCGYTGSTGALLVGESAAHFYTDGRYSVQARKEVSAASVHIVRSSLLEAAGNTLHGARRRFHVGFEAQRLTVSQKSLLVHAAGHRSRFKAVDGLAETLRAVKEPDELARMRSAARLGAFVMEKAISFLKPAVRESDVAAEIEYLMRRGGASGPAFETIVASGPRSAWPHAQPTNRRLRKNELVVLDLGAILRHYCCDLTRTVFLGKAPARVRRLYRAVQQAQEAARDAVCAGVAASEIDRAARDVLSADGLAKYFTHSTGHGLGLEVHEGPRVAKGQTGVLRAGNVITIEPGAYIEGFGGVRIEDDVVVTPKGGEVLTKVPRDLLEL